MIEPMKKVAVLMSAATQEQSLEDLRRLGVVHLQQGEWPPAPARHDLEEKLQLLRDVLALLPAGPAGGISATEQQAAEGIAVASELLALHRDR
jgi:vacuolar-type H+-ATPase subunit I/STV1